MDKQNSITIYNDLNQKRYFIESENDHLLVNGEKMSKSRGTYITAKEYLALLDPDLRA